MFRMSEYDDFRHHRLFLCDQLRRLDKRLKIEGADVDPEVVRFNVHRAGKLEVIGGPKKADVVLLVRSRSVTRTLSLLRLIMHERASG